MLCKDCDKCKTELVGYVSTRSYCLALPKKIRGVQPWRNRVNPRCPLKINKEEINDRTRNNK